MCKSKKIFIAVSLILGASLTDSVCAEPLSIDTPDSRQSRQKQQGRTSRIDRIKEKKKEAQTVFTKVEKHLDYILEAVSKNKPVEDNKLEEIKSDFLAIKRDFRYLEDSQQSDMILLDGWLTYLDEGSIEDALKRCQRSSILEPTNGDAYASSVVFSLLAGREPKPKEMVLRIARAKQNGGHPEMDESVLNLDMPDFAFYLLGKKLPIAALTEEPEAEYICLLVWTLAPENVDNELSEKYEAMKDRLPPEKRAAAESFLKNKDSKDSVDTDYVKEQISAFENLYKYNTAEGKVSFLSINIDNPSEVEEFIKKNDPKPEPMPGKSLSDLEEGFSEVMRMAGALMLIIDEKNAVRYVGGAEGFLPIMMLNNFVPQSQKERKLETEKQQLGGFDAHFEEAAPEDMPKKNEPNVSDANSLPDESQSENSQEKQKEGSAEEETGKQLTDSQRQANTEKLLPEQRRKAEKLISAARMFRGSHTRLGSSRRVVENCVEVIEKFPGTTYESEAREILDSVPEHQKEKYDIEQ